MKAFLLSISACLFCLSAACQTSIIPKAYNYFTEKEEWRLTIFDFKTFELRVKKTFDNYHLVVDGHCLSTDSTIRLLFNSSVTLDYLKKDTGYGHNVNEFIKGSTFKRVADYIIPKTPAGSNGYKPCIYGSYFKQVELHMGGTKITFDNKKRYTLTDSYCTGKFVEKGKYIQTGNIVTLIPNKKPTRPSSFLMDNSAVFANEYFLISRKIQPSRQPDKFANEEVFLYYFRM